MKIVYDVIGALALLGGIGLLGLALYTPTKYSLVGASAIQISQVYSEASYYGVMAIAMFALTGILFLATRGYSEEPNK